MTTTASKTGRVDVDETREALELLGLAYAAERLGELLTERKGRKTMRPLTSEKSASLDTD